MPPKVDITGQRFCRLIAKAEDGRTSDGKVRWLCVCDCGTVLSVRSALLINGNTRSCGCLRVDRVLELVQRRIPRKRRPIETKRAPYSLDAAVCCVRCHVELPTLESSHCFDCIDLLCPPKPLRQGAWSRLAKPIVIRSNREKIPPHLLDDWKQEQVLAKLEGRSANWREFLNREAPMDELNGEVFDDVMETQNDRY